VNAIDYTTSYIHYTTPTSTHSPHPKLFGGEFLTPLTPYKLIGTTNAELSVIFVLA